MDRETAQPTTTLFAVSQVAVQPGQYGWVEVKSF